MELWSLARLVPIWLYVSRIPSASSSEQRCDSSSFLQTAASPLVRAHSGRDSHSDGADKARILEKSRPTLEEVSSISSGRCLKFMHIPKTGGTSIDSVNMHLRVPVWDSLMYETYKRIAKGMGAHEFESKYGSNLGTMYDVSHKDFFSYASSWVPSHSKAYHMVRQPDSSICEDLHTVPGFDAGVTNFFTDGGCDVFCAVRDPFRRFISAYEMDHIGPCDPVGFEAAVRKFLPQLQKNPYLGACIWTPQVEYVYGVGGIRSPAAKPFCNKILHLEHLNQEFDAFMKERGINVTLPKKHLMSTKAYSGACLVDPTQVTQKAKDLIYNHYRADFDAFGYPPP